MLYVCEKFKNSLLVSVHAYLLLFVLMCGSHEMLYQNFCLFKIFNQLFLFKNGQPIFYSWKTKPLQLNLSHIVLLKFSKECSILFTSYFCID
jgi:hypothetical protein